jgi:hypothetical protein
MPKTASGAIRVDNVRISFCRVFVPKANDKDQDKYGVTMLIAKDHKDYGLLQDRVIEVAKAEWKERTADVMTAMKLSDKICIHDGGSKPQYPEYKGLMYINTYNSVRPTVYTKGGQLLDKDDGKLYSGCYANVIIDLWAQDNEYGQRVNAELMGIQFHADGESLAGGGKAASADDFDLSDQPENPFDDSDGGDADLAGLL